jgi:hypothetical protein
MMNEASVEADGVLHAPPRPRGCRPPGARQVGVASFGCFVRSIGIGIPPLKRLGHKAFQGSEIRSIVIPRSIEIIRSERFSDCEHLRSVTLEANSVLRRIESGAFSFCSALSEIVVPGASHFSA